MKFSDAIRAAPSFGAAIAEIRRAKGMCIEDLADLLALSAAALRSAEQSRGQGGPNLPGQIANVLGLSNEDRIALVEKRKRELLRAEGDECASCARGDTSSMHQGPGERFDDCIHAAQCIKQIALNFPTAQRAHCPQQCNIRKDVTREERRAEANLQGKDSHDFPRWGTVERKKFVRTNNRKAQRSRPRAT